MFWKLFRRVLVMIEGGKAFLPKIREALNAHNRMGGSLKQRQQQSAPFGGENADFSSSEMSTILAKELEISQGLNNQTIQLYRGFFARPGTKIRKGKYAEPDGKKQEDGAGASYTLDRDIAICFASRYRQFKLHPQMYAENRQRAEKTYQFLEKVLEGKPAIGIYSVDPEDVVLILPEKGEAELVILPESIEIKRYKFLTPKEIQNSWQSKKSVIKDVPFLFDNFSHAYSFIQS